MKETWGFKQVYAVYFEDGVEHDAFAGAHALRELYPEAKVVRLHIERVDVEPRAQGEK